MEQGNVLHMEKQLTELTLKVDKISEALLGNEFNKGGGLVSTVFDHEERLTKIEDTNVLSHEQRIKAIEDVGLTHKIYVNILKFIAAVITTGVLGFLLSLVLKK